MDHRKPVRRGALMILLATVVVGGLPSHAGAALVSDGSGNGNGHHNRNSVAVNDPTWVRGIQHVINVNVDGNTPTQVAFCRRWFRHCRISQHINAYGR